MPTSDAMIDAMLKAIKTEYVAARTKFRAMAGPHEGYGVIREEFDEFWDAIKANELDEARQECIQVAAMCLAFLLEVRS